VAAKKKLPRWPVILTMTMVGVVAVVFGYEFMVASTTPPEGVISEISADSYMDIVTPLLASADVSRGAVIASETHECHICHIRNAGQIAPGFEGLGARAAAMRPPLSAAAYLYEAIIYPAAHVVDGYSASMPANYRMRLTDQQLGDLIAYLLLQ